MADVLPRLSISFTPAQFFLLKRLASLQERSAGAIVREFIEAAMPVLEQVADTIEAMHNARDTAPAAFGASLAIAHAEILPHVDAVFNALARATDAEPDMFVSCEEEGSSRSGPEAQRSEHRMPLREGASDPRPLTGGSGFPGSRLTH